MKYKYVLCAYVREDPRINEQPVAKQVIYSDNHYEVTLFVFSGTAGAYRQDLIGVLGTYKDEGLRILGKLTAMKIDEDEQEYLEDTFIPDAFSSGVTPLQYIRDLKVWANLSFTRTDRAILLKAGLETHTR